MHNMHVRACVCVCVCGESSGFQYMTCMYVCLCVRACVYMCVHACVHVEKVVEFNA